MSVICLCVCNLCVCVCNLSVCPVQHDEDEAAVSALGETAGLGDGADDDVNGFPVTTVTLDAQGKFTPG